MCATFQIEFVWPQISTVDSSWYLERVMILLNKNEKKKKTSLLHKLLVYATACVQCIYSTATSPTQYKVISSYYLTTL